MSAQISTAFVQQYRSEVMHLSQQKGSRLQGAVRNETQKGISQFFDRIGAVTAVVKSSRHADTPQIDTPHTRRMVTLTDYEWADLIDKEDLRRLLADPAGDYAMAAAWAMGRAKDDLIIAAHDGNSYGGVAGATAITLPNADKYACNDASAVSRLNVLSLRGIKYLFDSNDVDPSLKRYGCVNAYALQGLLGETAVTSADFNTVKALVQGEINTFLGFEFLHSERMSLQVAALSGSGTTGAVGSGTSLIGSRKMPFWAKDGLLLATAADVVTEIDRRNDKSYSTQVYVSMGIGATRMEEVKVVSAIGKES